MKKYLSYSIISIILIALVGLILFLEIPRIVYEFDEELNGYAIVSVYGNSSEYEIPSYHKDKKVVKVANKAFEKQTRLKHIKFEENSNIILIEQNAFYKCTSLKEITIPKSVERINVNAFLGCSSLEKVTFDLDSNIKVLEGSIFFDCISLKEAILPKGNYEIGDYIFHNTSLQKLVLSKDVKTYAHSLEGVNKDIILYV